MELRGYRRANKPQSGLFSRHYYNGFPVQSLKKTWQYPLSRRKYPAFCRQNSANAKSSPCPADRGCSACRKSLFAPLSQFSELYKVLKTIDFNGAGHPSWVSRAHPSLPPRKTHHFIDSLRDAILTDGAPFYLILPSLTALSLPFLPPIPRNFAGRRNTICFFPLFAVY